ncbi:MAG: hypothetical protein WC986_13510 [Elusimicrobiota bacterium]|jgi:hypothetical protein
MKSLMTFDKLSNSIEVGHGGETKYLSEALDDAVRKVADAAEKANAKASLTLSLVVKPQGGRELTIAAQIKTSLPEPGAFPVRLWIDKRGDLVSEDPDQGRLPLEVVPAEAGGDRE